ncbi:transposase [archaeon]|nr:transposase [archaeon]
MSQSPQRHRWRHGRGPGGACVCPCCGYRVPHQPGAPCRTLTCPHCGTPLVRE